MTFTGTFARRRWQTPSAAQAMATAGGAFAAIVAGIGVAVDPKLGLMVALAALAIPVALVDLPLAAAVWTGLGLVSSLPAFGLATTAAGALTATRGEHAQKLEKAVGRELAPLKLDRARLHIEIAAREESAWGPDGQDRVTFLVTTNPGQKPGQLAKIASGGELSRLMLALKVVLARGSPVPSLVFDEVDSGIGGATAAAIGGIWPWRPWVSVVLIASGLPP